MLTTEDIFVGTCFGVPVSAGSYCNILLRIGEWLAVDSWLSHLLAVSYGSLLDGGL